MGIIKTAKAVKVGADAQIAWDKGRVVFTPVINYPSSGSGFSGGNEDMALMVEAVLAVGWLLDTWAVVTDDRGRPQAMPLFVRPGNLTR